MHFIAVFDWSPSITVSLIESTVMAQNYALCQEVESQTKKVLSKKCKKSADYKKGRLKNRPPRKQRPKNSLEASHDREPEKKAASQAYLKDSYGCEPDKKADSPAHSMAHHDIEPEKKKSFTRAHYSLKCI